ncbi:MAG: hypothetical protein QOF36_1520 [Microbacteriaceae bacterium]|jgi:hypothetical protein|nr:hypothetical protein [Microbacteriaceae bacterium]
MVAKATRRTRGSFWLDPRFVIGLGLVVGSVVGVSALVSAADRTTVAYAARGPLSLGDTAHASDLVATNVRLGQAGELYLSSGQLPAEGVVVTRAIAAGELVPLSAVGSAAKPEQTRVVVSVSGVLAASVGPGSVVDVWAAAEGDTGQFGPPAVLVDTATVVRLVDSQGLIARDGVSVEVQVPRDEVAAVLESVANGDVISIVPVSTPVGR